MHINTVANIKWIEFSYQTVQWMHSHVHTHTHKYAHVDTPSELHRAIQTQPHNIGLQHSRHTGQEDKQM